MSSPEFKINTDALEKILSRLSEPSAPISSREDLEGYRTSLSLQKENRAGTVGVIGDIYCSMLRAPMVGTWDKQFSVGSGALLDVVRDYFIDQGFGACLSSGTINRNQPYWRITVSLDRDIHVPNQR